jgi:tetratricopeptide (TPR) repeat protein
MDRNAILVQIDRISASRALETKAQLRNLLRILGDHYETQSTLQPYRVIRELWPEEKDRTSADLATAMNRLRKALEAYYAEEGTKDEVVIRLPKRVGEEAAEHRAQAWIATERRNGADAAPKTDEAASASAHGASMPAYGSHAETAEIAAAGGNARLNLGLQAARSRPWMRWAAGVAVAVAMAMVSLAIWRPWILSSFHLRSASTSLYGKNAPAEAQQQYLRGRYFWDLRTAEGLAKAIDAYAQAIAVDPSYADAYAGLAESYDLLPQFGRADLVESLARAKSAADRAIALNPNLATAHRAKGFALFFGDWDIAGSEAEFRRALALDPSSAQTHQWYASSLYSRLDGPDSIREIDEARRLDPVSPAIAADAAFIHAEFDDYGAGVQALQEIEQTQPTLATPPSFLQGLYFGRGDYQNYITEARRYAAITHDPDDAAMAEAIARGWVSGGKKGFLESRASMLEADFQRGTESGCLLGETWLVLGNPQRALPYFRASLDKRCLLFPALQECGWPKALAGSPGYTELFAEVRQRIAGWGSSPAACPNSFPRPQ